MRDMLVTWAMHFKYAEVKCFPMSSLNYLWNRRKEINAKT